MTDNLPMIKIDDKLRAIVGGREEFLRTPDLNKRLWAYIRANNLKAKKPE